MIVASWPRASAPRAAAWNFVRGSLSSGIFSREVRSLFRCSSQRASKVLAASLTFTKCRRAIHPRAFAVTVTASASSSWRSSGASNVTAASKDSWSLESVMTETLSLLSLLANAKAHFSWMESDEKAICSRAASDGTDGASSRDGRRVVSEPRASAS